MNMRNLINLFVVSVACFVTFVVSADEIATLRKFPLSEQMSPPRMEPVENNDLKRARNYPMQPPTIPHKIDGYQVDKNANRCLACHSRRQSETSQAPMVSVTHYMNRDGNFLAEVSPRRYFCNQCHVIQSQSKPLVENVFQDVDTILKNGQ